MLPLVTNRFTIQRASNIDGDSGDPLDWETIRTGVLGTPSYFSGSESVAHGSRERVDVRMFLPFELDLTHYDRILDEDTGDTWSVAYVRKRRGLGINHTIAGCYEVTGVARGTKDI